MKKEREGLIGLPKIRGRGGEVSTLTSSRSKPQKKKKKQQTQNTTPKPPTTPPAPHSVPSVYPKGSASKQRSQGGRRVRVDRSVRVFDNLPKSRTGDIMVKKTLTVLLDVLGAGNLRGISPEWSSQRPAGAQRVVAGQRINGGGEAGIQEEGMKADRSDMNERGEQTHRPHCQ